MRRLPTVRTRCISGCRTSTRGIARRISRWKNSPHHGRLHTHGECAGTWPSTRWCFPANSTRRPNTWRGVVEAGVDAVIVQDLGIANLLARMAPGLAVHGSTQMTLTEWRGVEFLSVASASSGVILARELSLDEIGRIRQHTDLPLEVFVHGALCVAYSGQCLTSESFGGRSATGASARKPVGNRMNCWSTASRATSVTRRTCSARRTWRRTT